MNPEEFVLSLRSIGIIIFAVMATSGVLCLLIFTLAYRSIRQLDIPPHADLTDTLLIVPLYLVIAIDLLDLALDVLAAPVAWVLLNHLGLRSLRNISTVEAIIPLTGAIPTLTIAWFLVRYFGVRF
jgi:hypothetical protein